MKSIVIILSLCLASTCTLGLIMETEPRVSFANYHVIQATANTEENLELLQDMEASAEVATSGAVEFWKSPAQLNDTCTISVHPELYQVVTDFFKKQNIPFEVLVQDLQQLIEREMDDILSLESEEEGLNYRDPTVSYYNVANFNRLNQITMHLRELQQKYSQFMTIQSIGTTAEGRSIEMATIADPNSVEDKPIIWLDCGIHAREWISPAFCMYTIKTMLEEGSSGLMRNFDFKIVAVANPDGYQYTWNGNRMWRKNRRTNLARSSLAAQDEVEVEEVGAKARQLWGQIAGGFGTQQQFGNPWFPGGQYPGSSQYPGAGGVVGGQPGQYPSQGGHQNLPNKCVGVDPNRNFDIAFGGVGTSPRPCDDTYHGPAAFSEAESRAIRDAINGIKASGRKLASYVSVHSYSQFWMLPNGYSKTKAPHHQDLMRVAQVATQALTQVSGTRYKYGPISKIIYQATGSSVDWAYTVAGVKYSYALELRDDGRYGFMLPLGEIEPTNKETYAGLVAMANEIAKEF